MRYTNEITIETQLSNPVRFIPHTNLWVGLQITQYKTIINNELSGLRKRERERSNYIIIIIISALIILNLERGWDTGYSQFFSLNPLSYRTEQNSNRTVATFNNKYK